MQSENYVPGVSGWKIDPSTGEFDLHSCRTSVRGTDSEAVYCGRSRDGAAKPFVVTGGTINIGQLPPEPQMVNVTSGEWPESGIPSSAIDRYKFIGDVVMQIPAEYRESAEFSTEDHSYDRDGSDIRTTLTYTRPETAEEATARAERAKVAGTRVIMKDDCMTIVKDGVVRVRIGNLDKPFVVEGDQVFLNSALVRDGVIKRDPLPDDWRVNMQLTSKGQYVVAGIGLGSQTLTSADKFAIKADQPKSEIEEAISDGNAQKILDLIAVRITDTDLGQGMKEQDEQFATRIRKVMAEELRPGGMLYRFNR